MKYLWKLRCVERSSRELFDRLLIFDPPAGTTEEQLENAIRILKSRRSDSDLLKIRQLFREARDVETSDEQLQQGGIAIVSASDYFEDETGRPLSIVDVVEIRSGQRNPIILGNVESVLRLPHASVAKGHEWTLEKSNDVTHLLQIVGILQSTEWARSPLSLSNVGVTNTLTCPKMRDTITIVPLLRQLLFQRVEKLDKIDDVFRRAVWHYEAHCSDVGKVAWIANEKQSFEKFVLGKSLFNSWCDLKGLANGEVLDTLIYGTGIIHRRSTKDRESLLESLQMKIDRQKLAFVLHSLCRELLSTVTSAAVLIQHDFAHWVNEGNCVRPSRVVIESVLDPNWRV